MRSALPLAFMRATLGPRPARTAASCRTALAEERRQAVQDATGVRPQDTRQQPGAERAPRGRQAGWETWKKRSCCRCSGAQRAALRFPTASGGTPWRCRIPAAALRRIPAASPRAKPPRYASLRRSAITPLISKTKGFSYSTSPEVQTFTCSDPERTPKGTNFRLLGSRVIFEPNKTNPNPTRALVEK